MSFLKLSSSRSSNKDSTVKESAESTQWKIKQMHRKNFKVITRVEVLEKTKNISNKYMREGIGKEHQFHKTQGSEMINW